MGVIRLTQGSETVPLRTTPSLGEVFGALAERPVVVPPRRARCPGCEAVYALPAETLPPWGARVACGECGAVFAIGARADANTGVRQIAERNADAWRAACANGSLWDEFGEALFACYEELRERYGTIIALRAFRPAVEEMAPGAPWYGPSVPANTPTDAAGNVTLFDRRRME